MPPPPTAPITPDADTPAALLALARHVAVEAAGLLREGRGGLRLVENKTTATDHVTEMDRAAEDLIVAGLLAARPDDGVLGEEGSSRAGTSGIRWVIDPLDGTTNYVYGFPAFAVSVAAERVGPGAGEASGGTLAGVVVDATSGDVFSAHRGGGARRNDEPIAVSGTTELAAALVATGFSYDAGRRGRQAGVLTAVLPRIRDVRRSGSAALDLCSAACGRVDAYYETGLNAWDWAAGALIAEEAGAVVGGLAGDDPSGAFVLAAPPALAGPLRDLLRAAGAGEV